MVWMVFCGLGLFMTCLLFINVEYWLVLMFVSVCIAVSFDYIHNYYNINNYSSLLWICLYGKSVIDLCIYLDPDLPHLSHHSDSKWSKSKMETSQKSQWNCYAYKLTDSITLKHYLFCDENDHTRLQARGLTSNTCDIKKIVEMWL